MTLQPWWKTAVGYEIYIRSFADSNADGIGDLAGIITKLDYLKDLGINLLWLTPFYPSPFVDYGYDVADYTGVDELFGNLSDFDRLIAEAHQRQIQVVADIVPNHSSSEHFWFQQARQGKDNPYRDYYIWADPGPDGGYPNNWVGYFGGPAWTFDDSSGQYYLHLFLTEQPDLNWANPAVVESFDEVLRFWLDRGVDGFRIDVAQAMAKDRLLRSNPQVSPWDPTAPRWEQWDAFEHRYDVGQAETLEIFGHWRDVVEPYGGFLLGETYVLEAEKLAPLLRGDGLHAGFWFKTMHMNWDPGEIRSCIDAPITAVGDPTMLSWVAASHDEVRPASRFGGGDLGRRRSLALSAILFGLPGLPFLYQGEELGLVDGVVPDEMRADPVGSDVSLSRDGCRTPMPWHGDGPSMGFSSAASTWLPMGGRQREDTAEFQQSSQDSWFSHYARLAKARRDYAEFADETFAWLDEPDALVAYRRGSILVAANVGDQPEILAYEGLVLFSSHGHNGRVTNPVLQSGEAIYLRTEAQ